MSARTFARLAFAALCCMQLTAHAQTIQIKDSLTLSLPEVEKRFVDSNFQLLAAHYNVDAQKALIEQAKVWDNPVLNTDQVIHANGKFFPYGTNPDGSYNGQYFIQVEQLIKTAGKRGKLINMATTNAKLSEWQLQDLLRNLRSQLHSDYYTLSQQLSDREILHSQQDQLKRLLTAMQGQLNAGNIAQKEYLRIQALLITLQQDITDLEKGITDTQADLKTLLQMKDDTFIKPLVTTAGAINVAENLDALVQLGKQNNPNYLLQQTQVLYQQQNLAYQKSLRVPDITLGPNFDRNSNYTPNYVGLGVSLPLPVFDKNKGNIKAAALNVKQQEALVQDAETSLYHDINSAYKKLLLTIQQNNSSQQDFYTSYKSMFQNMLSSYQQKQIGLLEFLDFFNDYTALQQRLNQQQLNLQLAKDELNYQVGTDVIK